MAWAAEVTMILLAKPRENQVEYLAGELENAYWRGFHDKTADATPADAKLCWWCIRHGHTTCNHAKSK